ncbi:hypothetical protein ACSBR1_015929 [Camellia fascicularis]
MAPRNLYDLFIKFGVVKDVFIPHKRRKATNSRFGFVRYDCSIAANVAEQRTNGLWVDDKSLSVKIAEFDKHTEARQRGKNSLIRQPMNHGTDGRSFAEVIKGDPRSALTTTIKVEEIGNGWLYESMIMRLKPEHTSVQVKNELIKREEQNVLVREGGGRDVFLSFPSKEDLSGKKSMVIEWFHDWGEYITVWSPSLYLQQQRQVWINCLGVPPNLWSSNTFRRIGSIWGQVISLDDNIGAPISFRSGRFKLVTNVMDSINTSINLECKGRVYPIRVFEEHSAVDDSLSCKVTLSKEPVEAVCSKIHGAVQLSQKHKPEKEDGDIADDMARAFARTNKGMTSRMKAMDVLVVGGSWSNTSVVAETVASIGNSNEEGTCVTESLLTVKSLHHRSNHFAQKGVEDQVATDTLQKRVECNQDPQFSPLVGPAVGGPTLTSGFIKSLSETSKDRPGICLEIALGHAQSGLQPNEPDPQLNLLPTGPFNIGPNTLVMDQLCEASGSTSSRLKKVKRKGARREGIKQSLFAGRFSGFARRVGHKGAKSSIGFKRGIRARSSTIHSSPSHTSDSIHTSPSKEILQEALQTLQVGKTLGIDYKGQESEVVKKFILMKEQDKVRMAGGTAGVE